MYSDQMEDRKSAKNRILSSIKRKVDNSTLSTEIYEEEEDSDEDLDMRQKLSRTRYVQGKSKNGSSSIFNRVGSTRSRKSSEHYPEEDSGDSLERDKGEDLGEMQMQMKIQVTQSDAEEGEEEKEGEELEEPQKQTERRYY